jgi:hypothetical protein
MFPLISLQDVEGLWGRRVNCFMHVNTLRTYMYSNIHTASPNILGLAAVALFGVGISDITQKWALKVRLPQRNPTRRSEIFHGDCTLSAS